MRVEPMAGSSYALRMRAYFIARPRLALRADMQRKEIVGYSLEGSNLARWLALGNRIRAALDGA